MISPRRAGLPCAKTPPLPVNQHPCRKARSAFRASRHHRRLTIVRRGPVAAMASPAGFEPACRSLEICVPVLVGVGDVQSIGEESNLPIFCVSDKRTDRCSTDGWLGWLTGFEPSSTGATILRASHYTTATRVSALTRNARDVYACDRHTPSSIFGWTPGIEPGPRSPKDVIPNSIQRGALTGTCARLSTLRKWRVAIYALRALVALARIELAAFGVSSRRS